MNLRIILVGALLCASRLSAAVSEDTAQAIQVTNTHLAEARKIEESLGAAIRKLVPTFVFIGGGSGVLIDADGLMLTNHHVAGASKRWRVRVGGKFHYADLLGTDPRGDISLLKLRNVSGMPFVEFADSDKLVVGQQVLAIGNPFNTAEGIGEPTVTQGILSALHRFQGSYSDAIQTDAPINPGNSGGPLFTLDGKLAGINGQIAPRFGAKANTGISMAIPVAQIQRFLPLLKAAHGGKVYHGFIRGLDGNAGESDGMQNGAEIKDVKAGSYAERLGLKPGDRITRLGDYELLNLSRFYGVLGTYPGGSTLPLTLSRSGQKETLTVKLETLNPGSLGVTLSQPNGRNDPAVVESVHPKLAGEAAGLAPGDVLLELQGQPTPDWVAWGKRLWELEPLAGDQVNVKVKRGAEELNLTLSLTPENDEPGTVARRGRMRGPHSMPQEQP